MVIVAILGLSATGTANADITVARMFSDHMVLQHSSTVNIRGTSEPGDKMVVKFLDQTVTVTSDEQGKWSAPIQTPEPGGPYEIEISVEENDPKVVIRDILIGEVWFCAGHNMEWPVAKSLNPETEIEQAKNFPNVRLFTVERAASPNPLEDFGQVRTWECCAPDKIGSFSAVAWFFGRELNKRLDVPVGLIHAGWQSTTCEAWTPRSALEESTEHFGALLEHWDDAADEREFDKQRPGFLFNGMVSPMKNFPFQGVIWYQGEANVGRGHQYRTLFPALIHGWRKELGESEFPFYFVQLASHRYEGQVPEALAELREAQSRTALDVPGTAMVVTTDIGDPNDLHPRNKQEVGRRLSLLALNGTYKELLAAGELDVAVRGPRYLSLSIIDGKVRLIFEESESGLVARDSEQLSHFSLCGEDGIFKPAEARIDDDAVIVTAEGVPQPVAVRFAWEDSAEPNFFNEAGLPAIPFRTDNFDLLSKGVDFRP